MTAGTLETEVVVIGGGVAGCCAAIALRQAGVEVILVEQSCGRPHRFCGEFISAEAADSLAALDIWSAVTELGPNFVRRMALYGTVGEGYHLPLAEHGLGLSRRALDSALIARAVALGARVLEGARVEHVGGSAAEGYHVQVSGRNSQPQAALRSRAVIGAQGKRSSVDRVLGRRFLRHKSRFVGVKVHCRGIERSDAVSLHLFPGGYGGVVTIEDGLTTICLLAKQRVLRASGGSPADLLSAARAANGPLAALLRRASFVPESWITIGQVPLFPKEPVANGVFMAGDSAGVMPPFLGVGVANAMRSGRVCAELVAGIVRGRQDYRSARQQYESWWQQHCRGLQRWGRLASELLCHPFVGNRAIGVLNRLPSIGKRLYRDSRAAGRPRDECLQRPAQETPAAAFRRPGGP